MIQARSLVMLVEKKNVFIHAGVAVKAKDFL